MKKVIRMTEADLTKLVRRVIEEQSQVSQIKSVDVIKPADKQMTNKITSVDNVKSTTPKQSVGTLTSVMTKPDPKEWFSKFPCLSEVPQSKRPMVSGNVVLRTAADGRERTLLPVSGKSDPAYRYVEAYKPVNNIVGQVKGGGVYYCSSEAYAKGFGPQIMKIN